MLIKRELSSMPLAGLITLGIFLLMYTLITRNPEAVSTENEPFSIHFGPVDIPVEPNPKIRPPPPRPEPLTRPPEAPKLTVPNVERPQPSLEIELPELDLTSFGDDGFGAWGPGTRSGNQGGDLYPISGVRPIYPRDAAMKGIEGYVLVEFTISPLGLVKNPKVLKADPRGVFERSALQAILKWKFKPQMEDGNPVERQATQEFMFRLDE